MDFRSKLPKKGFLGMWFNYKSETSFRAIIRYNDGTIERFNVRISGTSSHDGSWLVKHTEITPVSDFNILEIKRKTPPNASLMWLNLYLFKGYSVDIEVTYRGMKDAMYFFDTKDDIYGYTTSKNRL